MIRMAKRLRKWEKERLRLRIEEAKKHGGASALLFLEEKENALTNVACFFFCGRRSHPKGILSVFFPDETHAEFTVAEFIPEESMMSELFVSAIRECKRVNIEEILTLVDSTYGFAMDRVKGVEFEPVCSEYMLSRELGELAKEGGAYPEGAVVEREASEAEGNSVNYRLVWNGQVAAKCRILMMGDGSCYLFDLETPEPFRRKGMATYLIREIAKEYAKGDAKLYLQVSSQNIPAETLYRKLGFRTEEQRDYYRTKEC